MTTAYQTISMQLKQLKCIVHKVTNEGEESLQNILCPPYTKYLTLVSRLAALSSVTGITASRDSIFMKLFVIGWIYIIKKTVKLKPIK